MTKDPVIVKRDTITNWKKAKNYIPQPNVIIIMEDENKIVSLSLGDGRNYVNNLPNLLTNSSTVEDDILMLGGN